MAIPKCRHFKPRNRGFVEHNGKRHYLPGKYDSPESKEAYWQFLRDIDADMPAEKPASSTLGDLAAAFLLHAERHYGAGPGHTEFHNCKYAIIPLADVPVDKFGKRSTIW